MAGSLERSFLAFRRTGDPKALARVFDLVAAELLLIAAHVARDRQVAEDLVQGTFLTAIERRESFQAGRRLMPWLIGILVNLGRRRQRRLELDGEVSEAHLVAADDPVSEAERSELVERLSLAIEELPEAYRDVLNLRLVHGLELVQIGHALGRPLETVRTQWRRGRERLRDVLPRSLAGVFAGDLFAGRGLSAVREHVLSQASLLGATGPTVATGALLMKKAGLVLTVLVVACGAWLFWGGSEAGVRETDASTASVLSPNEVPGGETVSGAELADVPMAPLSSRQAVDASSAEAALRVRVVFDEDGTPVVGARVLAESAHRRPLAPIPSAVTDRAGAVELDGLPDGAVTVRAARGGRLDVTLPLAAEADVELRVPRGLTVTGRVIDSRRQPVSEAELWISSGPQVIDRGAVCGRTGADGRFRLRGIEPGRVLGARKGGRVPAEGVHLVGDVGTELDVELALGDFGKRLVLDVRDATGAPLVGAAALAGYTQLAPFYRDGELYTGRPPAWAYADEGGRIVVQGLDVDRVPVWVRAEGFACFRRTVELEERETHVDVTLFHGARVVGRILATEGEPVAHRSVRIAQEGIDPLKNVAYQGPMWGRAVVQTDEDGRFDVGQLAPGKVTIELVIAERGSVFAERDLVDGETWEWDGILQPAATITGRVVNESGAPIPGALVSARAEVETSHVLRSQRTDEEGRFLFRDATRPSYRLTAYVPGSDLPVPRVVTGVIPHGGPIEILFRDADLPSARLSGTLLDARGEKLAPQWVRIEALHGARTLEYGGRQTRVEDGHFVTGPLPAGRYQLLVPGSFGDVACFGPYQLEAGAHVDVGDLRLARSARLTVEVVDDTGSPLRRGEVQLLFSGSAWGERLEVENGRAESRALQPGTYRLATNGRRLPLAAVEVSLAAGDDTLARLELPASEPCLVLYPPMPSETQPVRITWRRGSGELLFTRTTVLGNAHEFGPQEIRLAPGDYEVELSWGAASESRSFRVSAATAGEVVRLPSPFSLEGD